MTIGGAIWRASCELRFAAGEAYGLKEAFYINMLRVVGRDGEWNYVRVLCLRGSVCVCMGLECFFFCMLYVCTDRWFICLLNIF